jgi:hypothetical protein
VTHKRQQAREKLPHYPLIPPLPQKALTISLETFTSSSVLPKNNTTSQTLPAEAEVLPEHRSWKSSACAPQLSFHSFKLEKITDIIVSFT